MPDRQRARESSTHCKPSGNSLPPDPFEHNANVGLPIIFDLLPVRLMRTLLP
jgi:hypothetical protein